MAKLTALEAFNIVAQNCGEAAVAGLTSLSGLQLVVWNKLIEAIQEICADQDTRWQFLESEGQIPLSTGNYKYLISSLTYGADLLFEDKESFRQVDSGIHLTYRNPQEWDSKYVGGIGADRTGYPNEIMKYGGYFVMNNQATAGENEKIVNFRYWKNPSYYVQATPTGTIGIPEPFDRIALCALATLKVLTYLGNDEAAIYRVQVFGNGSDIEGSIDKMKRIYTSPLIKPRVKFNF